MITFRFCESSGFGDVVLMDYATCFGV